MSRRRRGMGCFGAGCLIGIASLVFGALCVVALLDDRFINPQPVASTGGGRDAADE